MTAACISNIIVNQLGYSSEPGPIILLKINKGSKVCFYYTVLLLSLTVRLRLQYGSKPSFDAKEVVE